MFTGVIEEVGKVSLVQPNKLGITADLVLNDMKLGNSIAVNGVCLTVNAVSGKTFFVDVMPETLRRTNLGALRSGGMVNLEKPLTLTGRLGGHLVQGHVDGTVRVSGLRWEGGAMLVRFEAPPELMRYIVEKGFVAVDGISLTVMERDEHSFQVSIVEFTKRNTNLSDIVLNRVVNIEVDIIAKYVEQLLKPRNPGVTLELLRESGFLGSRG